MVLVTTYTQEFFLFFSPHTNQIRDFIYLSNFGHAILIHTVQLITGILSSAVFFDKRIKKKNN